MDFHLHGDVCHYPGSRWPWEKNGFENVTKILLKIGNHGNSQILPWQRIFLKDGLYQTFNQ